MGTNFKLEDLLLNKDILRGKMDLLVKEGIFSKKKKFTRLRETLN